MHRPRPPFILPISSRRYSPPLGDLCFASVKNTSLLTGRVGTSIIYEGLYSPQGRLAESESALIGCRYRSSRLHFGGNRALDGRERRFGMLRHRARPPGPGRRDRRRPCRPSASAPRPDQLDRIEAARQVRGDTDDDRRLAVGARHDGDDARADPPLQIVGQRFELAPGHIVDNATVERDLANALCSRLSLPDRHWPTPAAPRPARVRAAAVRRRG